MCASCDVGLVVVQVVGYWLPDIRCACACSVVACIVFFFFFQAEDGIRDISV